MLDSLVFSKECGLKYTCSVYFHIMHFESNICLRQFSVGKISGMTEIVIFRCICEMLIVFCELFSRELKRGSSYYFAAMRKGNYPKNTTFVPKHFVRTTTFPQYKTIKMGAAIA